MAIIEARTPDGRLIELTEVEVTKSGMLIVITDDEGQQITVHRNAWEQLVQTVNTMLGVAAQKAPAQEAEKKP